MHLLRLTSLAALLAGSSALAQDAVLLWGDTHVHTSWSVDAWSYGNFTIDADAAYRYASGQPVLHPTTRQRIRIDRPLDFLVVADHAEMLQLQVRLSDRDPAWTAKPTASELITLMEQDPRRVFTEITRIVSGGRQDILRDYNTDELRQIPWLQQVEAADRHNSPGKFTALIGWEWGPAPDGRNLHRVVFTDADGERASEFIPLGYYDTIRPEELWSWLAATSERTGADFVAIPHNSNLSGGSMFDVVDSDGRLLTAAYARERMRWEPVMEITQTKGTSETAPELSPDDAFADFEIRSVLLSGAPSPIDKGSYARSALLRGLAVDSDLGANPYQFGVIGSTDSHTGLVSVDESNHYGKLAVDTLPEQRINPTGGGFDPWRTSASGLAGVWATANTRAAIFAAFKRREVYGTSGPRIAVRFFGGFDFSAADAQALDPAAVGYRKGVPMGGDLTQAPAGTAPGFLFEVSKDSVGANLDRVQVIKGWVDASGITHERVYDVALAGQQTDVNGTVLPLPSTVDAATASYMNTVGAARLSGLWIDPNFDSTQTSFYYLRALEIRTPRHQVYDAVALQMDPDDTGYPVTIQERAWSSPIWYRPQAQ